MSLPTASLGPGQTEGFLGVIGCFPCHFLMQGDVTTIPILDAEMRCRLFYHSVFSLPYITHWQPRKW